jgi:hypothetical protein
MKKHLILLCLLLGFVGCTKSKVVISPTIQDGDFTIHVHGKIMAEITPMDDDKFTVKVDTRNQSTVSTIAEAVTAKILTDPEIVVKD